MARNTDRLPRLLRVGAVGAAAAAAGNAVIYGIGRAADLEYVYTDGGTEARINLVVVVGASLFTFAIGLLAAAVALWFGRPSLRVGQVIGGTLAVVSIYSSFDVDISGAASITLGLMHIVSGVAYVAALEAVRRLPQGEPSPEFAAASTA